MRTMILLASLMMALGLSSCHNQKMTQTAVPEGFWGTTTEFTFLARRAIPNNMDVVRVMNALPNTNSSQMLDLDPGYTLSLKNDSLKVDLPYFGRVYNASLNPSKNGLKLETQDFSVALTATKKNNLYKIKVNHSEINQIFIEVFPNGRAYVSIDSNDRQPISFDGEMKPIKP